MTVFKVTVVEVDTDGDEVELVFEGAVLSISSDSVLQVNVDNKGLFVWAPGYWCKASMVAQDG